MKKLALLFISIAFAGLVKAENGHQLWLRQNPVNKAVVKGSKYLAAEELQTYSNRDVELKLDDSMEQDAYRINDGVITAKNEIGLLYGAYALLSNQAGGFAIRQNTIERPYYKLRILNHWDNLNGTIERGYAGLSIFWSLENGQPKAINLELI